MTSPRSDDDLDETLEETFPASDAPANTIETGIRPAEPNAPELAPVTDNVALSRLELTVHGETAFLEYQRTENTLTIVHTEAPESMRGHHVGDRLVEAAIAAAHANGLRIIAICPFARAYMRRHRRDEA